MSYTDMTDWVDLRDLRRDIRDHLFDHEDDMTRTEVEFYEQQLLDIERALCRGENKVFPF